MTHDRLCPRFGGIGPEDWPDTRVCRCDLIEKVRADERTREANRRSERFGVWHDYDPGFP